MKIGILSDTHNMLRPEVLEALQGCDLILHAGDIAKPEILDKLRQIAPIKVVRGNNDRAWAEDLPMQLAFELEGYRFFMTHKKRDIPADVDADIVIFGHSHKYEEFRDGQEERMRNLQEYSDSVADSAAGVLAGSVLQLLHNAESVVHYRVFRNSVNPYDCSDSAGIVFSVV